MAKKCPLGQGCGEEVPLRTRVSRRSAHYGKGVAKKCPLRQGCGEKNAPWGKGSAVLMTKKNGKREKKLKEKKESKKKGRKGRGEGREKKWALRKICHVGLGILDMARKKPH